MAKDREAATKAPLESSEEHRFGLKQTGASLPRGGEAEG